MSSHHNTTLNSSQSPYKNKDWLKQCGSKDKNRRNQTLITTTFERCSSVRGEEDTKILIKGCEANWTNLIIQKG